MSRSAALFGLALAACNPLPDTVRLSAEVRDDVAEDAPPFSNAEVLVLGESGAREGSGRTDARGRLSADVPAGVVFHLVIDGEGHVPASFTGQSGLDDTFKVEDGVLHGVTDEAWQGWLDRFAGCPGWGEGGAVIAEPRIRELVDDNGEHPGVNAGIAEIWDPRSEEVVATGCYLDEAGEAYDPDATATGAAGVFAIFGVPEGTWVLSVGLEVLPGSYTWDDTLVYVPHQGVAPRFPAWVHFPLR